jgi:hypothetical protein
MATEIRDAEDDDPAATLDAPPDLTAEAITH